MENQDVWTGKYEDWWALTIKWFYAQHNETVIFLGFLFLGFLIFKISSIPSLISCLLKVIANLIFIFTPLFYLVNLLILVFSHLYFTLLTFSFLYFFIEFFRIHNFFFFSFFLRNCISLRSILMSFPKLI